MLSEQRWDTEDLPSTQSNHSGYVSDGVSGQAFPYLNLFSGVGLVNLKPYPPCIPISSVDSEPPREWRFVCYVFIF